MCVDGACGEFTPPRSARESIAAFEPMRQDLKKIFDEIDMTLFPRWDSSHTSDQRMLVTNDVVAHALKAGVPFMDVLQIIGTLGVANEAWELYTRLKKQVAAQSM